MDRRELLRRISTVHLVSRTLAEDLLAGEFGSVFKGQGIEFDQVRHYELGDDIRSIDWNVSARFGKPYVKLYREERELTVCIVLDCSASMYTGAGVRAGPPQAGQGRVTRYEQGVLAAAVIAFSAERTGQRVGAVFFDEEIRQIFSPRRGRLYSMAILSAALSAGRGGKGSNLGGALRGTGRLLKRRSLVVVISDFLALHYERDLGALCAGNDVIALRITDPLDEEIPDLGLLTLGDPETGLFLRASTGSPRFRSAWTEWHREQRERWEALCRRFGAAGVELSTGEEAPGVLARFFRSRRRP